MLEELSFFLEINLDYKNLVLQMIELNFQDKSKIGIKTEPNKVYRNNFKVAYFLLGPPICQ